VAHHRWPKKLWIKTEPAVPDMNLANLVAKKSRVGDYEIPKPLREVVNERSSLRPCVKVIAALRRYQILRRCQIKRRTRNAKCLGYSQDAMKLGDQWIAQVRTGATTGMPVFWSRVSRFLHQRVP